MQCCREQAVQQTGVKTLTWVSDGKSAHPVQLATRSAKVYVVCTKETKGKIKYNQFQKTEAFRKGLKP